MAAEALDPGGPVLDAAGVAGLRELDAGSGLELVAEVVATFVADANVRVSDLQRAVATGDTEAIARDAHSLKGSSASVAATIVAVLCGEIETAASRRDMSEAATLVGRLTIEVSRACSALRRLFPGGGSGDAE